MKGAQNISEFESVLRDAGFRATPRRIKLLSILAGEGKPMSINGILGAMGKRIDQATVYRALEDLAYKGVVSRVDLRHGHAHFEFVPTSKHHHHLVCTSCGTLEDMDCPVAEIKKAPASSKKFKQVRDHSAEFFSLCNSCDSRLQTQA